MSISIKRKYIYETLYTVQGFYYGEWEDETTEETFRDAKVQLKAYRENMPQYIHRIKRQTTRTLKP